MGDSIMAITHNEVQVQWSAANSASVTAGLSSTSDAVLFATTAVEAMVHVKADNNGTPSSGDTIDVFALYTGGDPDGTGTDEYDTTGHPVFLLRLDTNKEDPALGSVPISVAAKGIKLYAFNNASVDSITVSATITEVRG